MTSLRFNINCDCCVYQHPHDRHFVAAFHPEAHPLPLRPLTYPHVLRPASRPESVSQNCGLTWLSTLVRLMFWVRMLLLGRRVWRWIKR